MALTSSTDSPSTRPDTPTVDTATLAAIRAFIQPRTGWWQFEIKPWHVAVFFGSYVLVVGSFVAFAATHGSVP